MDNNAVHFGRNGLIILSFYFLREREEVWFYPFEKLQAVEVTAHQILFYVIYVFYFLNKVVVKCFLHVLGFHQVPILLGITT